MVRYKRSKNTMSHSLALIARRADYATSQGGRTPAAHNQKTASARTVCRNIDAKPTVPAAHAQTAVVPPHALQRWGLFVDISVLDAEGADPAMIKGNAITMILTTLLGCWWCDVLLFVALDPIVPAFGARPFIWM